MEWSPGVAGAAGAPQLGLFLLPFRVIEEEFSFHLDLTTVTHKDKLLLLRTIINAHPGFLNTNN